LNYGTVIAKRKIEGLFIYPFVLLGRLIAKLYPLQAEYELFFFFPFYHTGGVEKYNLAIAQATSQRKGIIFFTRKSTDTTFWEEFNATGHTVMDISRWTDNKFIYWANLIYRGIVSGYINGQKKSPIVFNGQSNFGYKLSPWVHTGIRQLECIHTFSTFTYIRQPFVSFYQTVFSPAYKTINDHKAYYAQIGVPVVEANKFVYLITGISVPATLTAPVPDTTFKVLFVGRGSPEKRVHLVAAIAEQVKQQSEDVTFILAGEVGQYIPEALLGYCDVRGNISNAAELQLLYKECDILLLTSLFEGFPLVVMEAMAMGLAVVSTAVGDIPVHVRNGENGFLIEPNVAEESIVTQAVKYIQLLQTDSQLLAQMRSHNHQYAKENFAIEQLQQKLAPFLKNNEA